MTVRNLLFSAALLAASPGLRAQGARHPHLGYVYPAGGRQGTSFEVLVGGQRLRGALEVQVSGEGVEATVVKFYRPRRNLMAEQRRALRAKIDELRAKRLAELPGEDGKVRPWRQPRRRPGAAQEGDELPEHPLLRDMESMCLRQLQHIENEFLDPRYFARRQPNSQLEEMVVVRVTIDPKAAPGDREFRLLTPQGPSNPLCFQVGTLPEILELEPNDPGGYPELPPLSPARLPVVFNGQILPGDVDRLPFVARSGQRLVVRVQARHLIPYLADAVPGWFQATVALFDPQGVEVAFADDYHFDPDPVLLYEVPADGVYELEVRDAIYRGREDFVYRISVGELPFITSVYPLGAREGSVRAQASVSGWNLPGTRLPLDTSPGGDGVRRAFTERRGLRSNEILYAVGTLPETGENEPNDDLANARQVLLPHTINGRIDPPGDVDVFRFRGRRHQDVVVEIVARTLRSPLDSLVRVLDARGEVLAWNDDFVPSAPGFLFTGEGLLTHHADSYLRVQLPRDGLYYVQISDARGHGGEAYAYRLRLSEPMPDFALRVGPSNLGIPGGRTMPLTVYAMRRDGFSGAIELGLRDAPEGMVLSGGVIPAGQDQVRITLTAPREVPVSPFPLLVEGTARIGEEEVVRLSSPVDDVMQAFLYRHLAPAEELAMAVQTSRWGAPRFEIKGPVPVPLAPGGTTEVHLKTPPRTWIQGIDMVLDEPPKGISLSRPRMVPDGWAFTLTVDADAPDSVFAGNLIVHAFGIVEAKPAEGGDKPAVPATRRTALGYLPAIPFEMVRR